jgi:Uma2 family endonuclease
MDVKSGMSVEEYLRTSFDDADREYLDGEVVERNMGEAPHAAVQGRLIVLLTALTDALRIVVLPEIRIQVAPTRFRVADVAVWRRDEPIDRIPKRPPFLAVEVLSHEDRPTRIQPKIQEYLRFGIEWVWIIDPDERRALIYSPADPGGTLTEELRTEDPRILISLADVLSVLD